MKNILLFLFCFGVNVSVVNAAVIYEVNTVDPSIDNDSTGSIQKMLDHAILAAQGGTNVIIKLNVPLQPSGDALIPLSESLEILDLNLIVSAGSITITPDLFADMPQGFKLELPGQWDPTIHNSGITIVGSNDITIEGLVFKGFTTSNTASPTVFLFDAIRIFGCYRVNILNNRFIGNKKAVSFASSDVYVKGNYFDNNVVSIDGNQSTFFSMHLFQDVNIIKNVFEESINSFNKIGIRIVTSSENGDIINIDSNKIYLEHSCIRIINLLTTGQNTPTIIYKNDIGVGGIRLINPRTSWTVEENTLNGMIELRSNYYNPGSQNDWGLSFINPNTIVGLPLKNSYNNFINTSTSFKVDGSFANGISIIGYELNGLIDVKNGYPTTIRENLIHTNGNTMAIDLTSSISGVISGNTNLDELQLNNVIYSSTGLAFDFSVTDYNSYGKYIVEFFVLDGDNDLVEFLGREEVTSNVSNQLKNFTNVIVPAGGKLGATITSYGTANGAQQVGTSEVKIAPIYFTPIPCEGCSSFKPLTGESYWMSAWVKVKISDQVMTYDNGVNGANIVLVGYGSTGFTSPTTLYPTGEIIDGWQRMVGKINIPSGTENVYVKLNADDDFPTYFDDIRIHPFNGSMKSYVYDGETFWLTSELDDNNYATFYEYDNEGGLIRIKKETSRGIVTIQETRSHTSTQK